MAQILHRDTSKQLQSLHQIQHKGHAYDRDTTTRVKKGKKELTKYKLHIKQKINKVHYILPLSLKFTLTLDLISFLVFKPAGGLKEPNLHIHLSS